MNNVVYLPSPIPDFEGNPLIEALPPISSQKDIAKCLLNRPKPPRDIRSMPAEVRLMTTQQIVRFHQPLQSEMTLAMCIDKCLRWGYVDRNPATPEYVSMINERYEAGLLKALPYKRSFLHTYGFAVLGVSGVGKSTSTELILNHYPQYIRHEQYNSIPLGINQVVWLKLDCPSDGSLKALCKSILDEFDHLLGTDYTNMYRKCTLDDLLIHVADVAAKENLGLLVIDEIQHLSTAGKDASVKALNFLVSLVNKIGVPVILIGTPSAKRILQQDFQQAKRASGQGDITFGSLDKSRTEWKTFLKGLWSLQFTKENVELTDDMETMLFSETFGNQFLLTVLYMLVQEDAILSQRESFDAKAIREVAQRRLALTGPMRKALQKHDDVSLHSYLEEKGIFDPWHTNVEFNDLPAPNVASAPAPKAVDKSSESEKAIRSLVEGFGLTYNEAVTAVTLVVNDCKEIPPHTKIAVKAFKLHLSKQNVQEKPESEIPVGYEGMKTEGMIGGEVV